MAGIAGIAHSKRQKDVERMLEVIKHRGPAGKAIFDLDSDNVTLGVVWPTRQKEFEALLFENKIVRDSSGTGHLAEARAIDGGISVSRDSLGAAPLYTGWTEDHVFCFASEVKALLKVSKEVYEVPPGVTLDLKHYDIPAVMHKETLLDESPDKIAETLFQKLDQAVKRSFEQGAAGCWLSGGLDSSVLCALLRPYVKNLHTFSVGMIGSSDLYYAQQVANQLGTEHHELVVDQDRLVEVMPRAIYNLESFDARLVRSSLMNYLVGELAAKYVPAVLSGEAGDELFAGYDYLKTIALSELPAELLDIQGRLHNTAFHRVDRSSAGHGLIAHLPFADPDVVQYARKIPAQYLIKDGMGKWILRQALRGKLTDEVLWRGKAKFWEGSGINDLFVKIADEQISDIDFEKEKTLPNGWILSSKEELMYYRVFKERFGEMTTLDWMGRTK
jgi:asparagine synthase (glutamine-hydrolysing)